MAMKPPPKSAEQDPLRVVNEPLEVDPDAEIERGRGSMPNHSMLDLETLGKKSGCVIISIGIVKFDPFKLNSVTEIMDGEFYLGYPDRHQQQRLGAQLDVSTVEWWVNQTDKAKAAMKKPQQPVEEVLDDVTKFLRGCSGLWCNGPSFDTPILRALFNRIEQEMNVVYWKDLCCRTAKFLAGGSGATVPGISNLTAHTALDDAIKQAALVQRHIRMMRDYLNQVIED